MEAVELLQNLLRDQSYEYGRTKIQHAIGYLTVVQSASGPGYFLDGFSHYSGQQVKDRWFSLPTS